MIYLLLSVLASATIFVLFKLFKTYKVDTLQAIVVNYVTACSFGLWHYSQNLSWTNTINSKWFYGALFLGFMFIGVFNLMALTAQRNGLSVASVASKMSVIIPVFFGLYMYKESITLQKISGIILALIAVYLTAVKTTGRKNLQGGLILPLILFLGSGIIDTFIKYLETNYILQHDIPIFSAAIFGCAALIGMIILILKGLNGTLNFNLKNILGGIVLGLVNYYSIYYLMKALQFKDLESSTLFTLNNVSIVMVTTLIGLLLFKESISKKNWLGITLAIAAILLVTLS